MPTEKAALLIVKNEPSTRESLSGIFSEFGYRVRSAEDGFSALVEIRNNSPDIILSDLNMPGMSGFELLSVIRRRFPAIRVIAMSGSSAGTGIPAGVAADAFYEKGSPVRSLLAYRGNHGPSEKDVSSPPRQCAHTDLDFEERT